MASAVSLSSFQLSDWKELVHSGTIFRKLINYPPVDRIIREFKRYENCESAKNIYLNFLLSGEETIQLHSHDETTKFLANLGLLIPYSSDGEIVEDVFTPTCRFLQDCISLNILPQFIHQVPPLPPKMIEGKISADELLKETITHLNYEALKQSTSPNGKLKEAVYSFQFVALLRAWLPLNYTIVPEVTCSGKTRADILIRYKDSSVIFEFLSNENYGPETKSTTMLGHIKRAADYGKAQKAEVWVVHFKSLKVTLETYDAQFPTKPLCSCAYVLHNPDCSKVRVVTKALKGEVSDYEFCVK